MLVSWAFLASQTEMTINNPSQASLPASTHQTWWFSVEWIHGRGKGGLGVDCVHIFLSFFGIVFGSHHCLIFLCVAPPFRDMPQKFCNGGLTNGSFSYLRHQSGIWNISNRASSMKDRKPSGLTNCSIEHIYGRL